MNGQADYPAHFQQSVKSYLTLEGLASLDLRAKTTSMSSMRHSGSEPGIPEFVRLAHNIRDPRIIDQPLAAGAAPHALLKLPGMMDGPPVSGNGFAAPVVLISCDDCYLAVFADYFIRTFRSRNQNIVHFHIVADDVVTAREYLTR